jgi:hypothetical protein
VPFVFYRAGSALQEVCGVRRKKYLVPAMFGFAIWLGLFVLLIE